MDIPLITNATISAAGVITQLYLAPAGDGVIVTAFTASNDSTASASYKAYIYDATGAAVRSVIPFTIVNRDRYHSGASLVNQVIPGGWTLRVENSTGDAFNFYATGRTQ